MNLDPSRPEKFAGLEGQFDTVLKLNEMEILRTLWRA